MWIFGFWTERDWSQKSYHGNNTKDVISFICNGHLWCQISRNYFCVIYTLRKITELELIIIPQPFWINFHYFALFSDFPRNSEF